MPFLLDGISLGNLEEGGVDAAGQVEGYEGGGLCAVGGLHYALQRDALPYVMLYGGIAGERRLRNHIVYSPRHTNR